MRRVPTRFGARTVYLTHSCVAAASMAMIFTALSAYYVRDVGMNPLQLILVGTAVEATCFVFEVPTGIVADIYSRRLSVIIGGFLIAACYLAQAAMPLFIAIVVAEVVRGVGETFISGAHDAWIADEVGPERVGEVFMRGSQVSQPFWLAGVVASVLVASVLNYQAAIFAGATLLLGLQIWLIRVMPEYHFKPTPREDRNTFQHMRHTFGEGARVVRRSPVLLILVLVELVFGASSEGFDRLWESLFLTEMNMPTLSIPILGALDPIAWFAIFQFVTTLLSMSVVEVARRRINPSNERQATRVVLACNVVVMFATIALAASGNFVVAAGMLIARSLALSVMGPVRGAWMNQHIPSGVRATVLSMNSQSNALGQIAGGPAVGWMGVTNGVRAAIAVSGVLLAPAVALFGRALRQSKPDLTALTEPRKLA